MGCSSIQAKQTPNPYFNYCGKLVIDELAVSTLHRRQLFSQLCCHYHIEFEWEKNVRGFLCTWCELLLAFSIHSFTLILLLRRRDLYAFDTYSALYEAKWKRCHRGGSIGFHPADYFRQNAILNTSNNTGKVSNPCNLDKGFGKTYPTLMTFCTGASLLIFLLANTIVLIANNVPNTEASKTPHVVVVGSLQRSSFWKFWSYCPVRQRWVAGRVCDIFEMRTEFSVIYF